MEGAKKQIAKKVIFSFNSRPEDEFDSVRSLPQPRERCESPAFLILIPGLSVRPIGVVRIKKGSCSRRFVPSNSLFDRLRRNNFLGFF
jgi:hypothetical protein